jgi:hypothetical protein
MPRNVPHRLALDEDEEGDRCAVEGDEDVHYMILWVRFFPHQSLSLRGRLAPPFPAWNGDLKAFERGANTTPLSDFSTRRWQRSRATTPRLCCMWTSRSRVGRMRPTPLASISAVWRPESCPHAPYPHHFYDFLASPFLPPAGLMVRVLTRAADAHMTSRHVSNATTLTSFLVFTCPG